MGKKTMTAKEFAAAMDVDYTTAIRWLKKRLVPGAYSEEVFPGMEVWRIPREALKMQRPKAGRSKSSAEKGRK